MPIVHHKDVQHVISQQENAQLALMDIFCQEWNASNAQIMLQIVNFAQIKQHAQNVMKNSSGKAN